MLTYQVCDFDDLQLLIAEEDGHIVFVGRHPEFGGAVTMKNQNTPLIEACRRQVGEYLAGERQVFDLPIAFTGTPFAQRVYRALIQVPYGELVSYQWLAEQVGSHPRPVGTAVGNNPLLLIVPCHRVLGKHSLGGFSAGMELKYRLLELEGHTLRADKKDLAQPLAR